MRGAVAIRTRRRPAEGLIAALSRSHLDAATDAFAATLPEVMRLVCGSALKFCRGRRRGGRSLSELAPVWEWDVAAGHAVLAAAGAPLTYGRPGFRVPAFIAWGDPAAAPSLLSPG